MNNVLISRSALRYEHSEKCCGECCYCTERDNESGECGLIRYAPVVDAEPVRHGRWELGLDTACDCEFIKCSVCSEEFCDGENDTVDILYNYCPNCGRKMDAEVEG